MADRELIGGIDAWVGAVAPAQNHNGGNTCIVQDASSGNAYMLLYIDAPAPVDAGSQVLEATLKLHLKFASTGSLTFRAAPLSDGFKASKVNWNNKPSITGTGGVTASVTGAGNGTIVEFDVTDQLQKVADGANWYGWRISLDTSNQLATVFASEAGADWRRPTLSVTYSNAPAPPTDLSPSGGRFISIGAPVLRYTYLDFGGNKELTNHQIQVEALDSNGDPTGTILLDTGEIPTSAPEYDLSADPTFVALANGAAARWRVKVWDGAELESDWSDWASFERLNKGTLTIDFPAAAPNNFVQETTPPVGWTHAGSWAQVAFQVIVEQKAVDNWFEVYNTGKLSGNDDSWTLPKGVLTTANWSQVPVGGGEWETVATDYRLTIRTWDGQGRQRTPGDPVYYQARREFDVREGATAKVTNLAVVADPPYPWAVLTWNRSTAPDKFVIVRGGNLVDTVTPDEVFVEGTSYRYIDKMANANRDHTWTVLPVVNGVMATAELQVVTARVESPHMWLTNPDRDNKSAVILQGYGDVPQNDLAMEDQGETYDIVGSSQRHRVTNALPGYSGTVSGALGPLPEDWPLGDITGREWVERLLDFKTQTGQRLILHLADQVIPVVAFNISYRAIPKALDWYEFSFEVIEDRKPRWVDS